MGKSVRVLLTCTGVGVVNRGIESFFREAFDGLKDLPEVEAKMIVGKNPKGLNEKVVPLLSRNSKAARIIGRLTGRTAYAVEQISSFPAVAIEIRRFQPHVIFSSEANLFFLLNRFRNLIGVPYKLLFSNGGPCHPPFSWTDYVHQVAPVYEQEAIASGEPALKHIMVPYGIHVPDEDPEPFGMTKEKWRRLLNLPVNRRIVISVGWISAIHKRMDYTIREVASIPKEQRPFLLLLGNIDNGSQEIIDLAREMLDSDDYSIRSVPYEEVTPFYKASDVFVLSSLREGFGRVYLEALMNNLPVIAHQHPVMQYVVGRAGILADLEKPGTLRTILQKLFAEANGKVDGRTYVRQYFDWKTLAPHYQKMFIRVKGDV